MSTTPATLPGPNVAHFLKLTETNYLNWLRQMRPFLHGHNLWKYVDGSCPAPSPTLTIDTGASASASPPPNPAYAKWFQEDQLVVSYLTTTLTEPILSVTVGHDTSKAIWDCLQQYFSQQSVANAANFRFQLLDMNKGAQSVSAYLQHAKSLSDSLAAINEPVSNADLVTATFRGLGPSYAMIVTAILNFPPLPSFTELRSRLLSFESQTGRASINTTAPTTALFSSQTPHAFRSPSRGSYRGNHNSRFNNRGSWSCRGRGFGTPILALGLLHLVVVPMVVPFGLPLKLVY